MMRVVKLVTMVMVSGSGDGDADDDVCSGDGSLCRGAGYLQ